MRTDSPLVLGVDPGREGAAVLWRPPPPSSGVSGEPGVIEDCFDLPHIVTEPDAGARRRGSRSRAYLNVHSFAEWLRPVVRRIGVAGVEEQLVVAEQSPTALATTFRNFGALLTVLALLGIPVRTFAPSAWKVSMLRGLPKGKGSAVKKALELAPGRVDIFHGPRGGLKDGRAEALLIAMYTHKKGNR